MIQHKMEMMSLISKYGTTFILRIIVLIIIRHLKKNASLSIYACLWLIRSAC